MELVPAELLKGRAIVTLEMFKCVVPKALENLKRRLQVVWQPAGKSNFSVCLMVVSWNLSVLFY